MVNVVVLVGILARPAAQRTLPSGSRLVTLEVTVRPEDGPAETAPVAWFDAPAWATALDSEDPVIVIGRVRRRFFRLSGATASRTEVVASRVLRGRANKPARAALGEVCATLEAAAAGVAESRRGG